MSIELATTQPVRRPGMPAPVGGAPLPPDKLGLTLRERLWLARAALGTMALSVVAALVLLSYVPAEHHARPVDPLANRLAEQADRPSSPPPHPTAPTAELPSGELHRAVAPAEEPPAIEQPEPAPVVASPAPRVETSAVKPHQGVVILRNTHSKQVAPWPVIPEAVRLDVPQPLAPKKVEYQEREPVKAAPAPKAEEEPDLKRPSFE